MAIVVFVGLLALYAFSILRALDRDDDRRLPTARQRRQWKRERLDLNPAMRGRR